MTYIKIFILLTIFLSYSFDSFACKCVRSDVFKLYENSDFVFTGKVVSGVNEETKKFSSQYSAIQVKTLASIKGEVPKLVELTNQIITCGNLKPRNENQLVLFFMQQVGLGKKLTSSCIMDVYKTNKDGLFQFKEGTINKDFIKEFLQFLGKSPNLNISFSHWDNHGIIETKLHIENNETKPIKIYHPALRRAYSFVIYDNLGNLVTPVGFAKVNPTKNILNLKAGETYTYNISSQNAYYPYLTNTGLFGFKELLGYYDISLIYRPFGGSAGTLNIPEKRLYFTKRL